MDCALTGEETQGRLAAEFAARKRPVAIDTRMAGVRGTGVTAYTDAVLRALSAVGVAPLTVGEEHGPGFGEQPLAQRLRRAGATVVGRRPVLRRDGGQIVGRDLFRRAQSYFDLRRAPLHLRVPGPVGLVHWMYPVPVVLDGWANVYTLHDAIPFAGAGDALSPVDAGRLRARIAALASRAAGFVTVSAHARDAIVRHLDLPPERIAVCGAGLPDMATTAPDRRAPPRPYLLMFGLTDARKNIARTVAAWQRAATGLPLVVVAADGSPTTLYKRLGRPDGLTMLGWQERGAMMALLEGARALLFPSLAEGFGLPIIEAMALGVPVLTSAIGACAETAGGAALLADPTDVAALADAIVQLAHDDALCDRLRAAGQARAAAFTPSRFGTRLLAGYAQFDQMPSP